MVEKNDSIDQKEEQKKADSNSFDYNQDKYECVQINSLKKGAPLILKKRNMIGVDIGFSSIKLVQIDATKKIPLIYGFVYEEIPFDKRDKGKATQDYILSLIKKIIKSKKLYDSIAMTYLSGKGTFVYSGTIDKVPENENVSLIKSQIEEKIPFDMEQSVFKHSILGENIVRGVEKQEFVCVAAEKERIKHISWFVEECGLQITGLSMPAFSFENVFQLKKDQDLEENIVVINFGAKRTEINYYRQGRFMANRELSVAFFDILKSLKSRISIDSKVIQLSDEEAEWIVRNIGIQMSANAFKDNAVLSRLVSLYRPVFEKMTNEIKRSLAFFQRSAGIQSMDKIYIVGGGANIKNISRFIKKELDLNVEFFPYKQYFKIDQQIFKANNNPEKILNALIPGMGLLFGSKEKSINLVPGSTALFSSIVAYKHFFNLVVGGVLLSMVVLFCFFYKDKQEIEKVLNESEEQLGLLDRQANQIETLNSFKKHFLFRKQLIEGLVTQSPEWKLLFYELSRLTPQSISYEVLDVSVKGDDAVLKIKGKVDTSNSRLDNSLSELMGEMEKSPFFNRVELIKMESRISSDKQDAAFEIEGGIVF